MCVTIVLGLIIARAGQESPFSAPSARASPFDQTGLTDSSDRSQGVATLEDRRAKRQKPCNSCVLQYSWNFQVLPFDSFDAVHVWIAAGTIILHLIHRVFACIRSHAKLNLVGQSPIGSLGKSGSARPRPVA